ncbi:MULTISPECIES: hypothetical protein [Haematobacter]|uniref:Uncharacterized protein n=1 Tax=Haematobacter massiliensis TaxID=195105 RepID=A0A086Y8T6_9RHOB|nr:MULTISPECIES: hypothetical protein [Haematobacter]KFI30686.1 hypothetical protein CN97_12755 [Haematobacter massiliensis]OWJ70903.1 hypothetical protein CDV50_11250 [Haematobacter massiliensis]OWJ87443.1 hypothetical protein CDV51_06865 [Haematobacter massiliensis]QBJ24897.1 hypothetical protein HmaOT1_11970 [Haematobacter massiliensis]
MTHTFTSIGKAAARVGHRATLRAQLLEHLRSVGGVRTLSELAEELGRDCTLLRADLDFLEAASLVWRRDMTWAPFGVELTEPCWWAPRVPMPAQPEGRS